MAYKVAYHMEGMTPSKLRAMKAHHYREAGDLEHCDPELKHLNEIIHGDEFFAEDVITEVRNSKTLNMRNEVVALRKRGRPKEADRRQEIGGIDPWKESGTLGPIRSIVLTADAEFFRQSGFEDFDGAAFRDPEKVKRFRDLGVAFLDANIPREHCIFMSYECDEKAPHFHAYYRAWNEKDTKTKGKQRMLQPTDMIHFRNAEKAQDAVAEWFRPMGLVRGDNTAQQRRDARARGDKLPPKAKHTPAWLHRREQRIDLLTLEKSVAEKAMKADARIAAAEAVEAEAEKESIRSIMELKSVEEERRRNAEILDQIRVRREERDQFERERARLDALAEKDRQTLQAALAERERGVLEREREVTVRETAMAKYARHLGEFADRIFDAVRELGLTRNPAIRKAYSMARQLGLGRKKEDDDQK